MSTLYALVTALIIVVIGVFLKIPVFLTLIVSLTLFSILVFNWRFPVIWLSAFNENMFTIIASLASAMYLAELFRSCKVSEKAINVLEYLSPKIASITIPALIGLLPMPAGAYISATLVNDIYIKGRLRGEDKTFINFWFRHIWITVWPLYQGVLLASYVLGWSVNEIVVINWPIFITSILAGLIMSWRILPQYAVSSKETDISSLIHLWPFAIIALLNIGLKINIAISTIITVFLFTLIYRPGKRDHLRALKYSLNYSILAIIITSLIYSYSLSQSNVAVEIASLINYPEIACYLIPFLIVFATGFEFTYSAIALPVLISFINKRNILLMFLGGFTGSMLSPVHVCLILSAQYFKAELKKVYKYTIPATLLTTIISTLIAYTIYS